MSELFKSAPVQEQHEAFMREVFEILLKDAVFQGTSRNSLVTEWTEPETLRALLGPELPNEPQTEDHLIQLIKKVVRYSVKTGHPRFINQLFSR